ncbi:MAG: hypothetical protein ACTSWD_16630 [Candidatus Heimdallarchaeota archaeon]
MRILNFYNKKSLKSVALYLTKNEAIQFKENLEDILSNPEAPKHHHIYDLLNPTREISFSIITEQKLQNTKHYNKIEQKILKEP